MHTLNRTSSIPYMQSEVFRLSKAFKADLSSNTEFANNFTIPILLIVSTICPEATACALALFADFVFIRGKK